VNSEQPDPRQKENSILLCCHLGFPDSRLPSISPVQHRRHPPDPGVTAPVDWNLRSPCWYTLSFTSTTRDPHPVQRQLDPVFRDALLEPAARDPVPVQRQPPPPDSRMYRHTRTISSRVRATQLRRSSAIGGGYCHGVGLDAPRRSGGFVKEGFVQKVLFRRFCLEGFVQKVLFRRFC
jgi:hypothetical protein